DCGSPRPRPRGPEGPPRGLDAGGDAPPHRLDQAAAAALPGTPARRAELPDLDRFPSCDPRRLEPVVAAGGAVPLLPRAVPGRSAPGGAAAGQLVPRLRPAGARGAAVRAGPELLDGTAEPADADPVAALAPRGERAGGAGGGEAPGAGGAARRSVGVPAP